MEVYLTKRFLDVSIFQLSKKGLLPSVCTSICMCDPGLSRCVALCQENGQAKAGMSDRPKIPADGKEGAGSFFHLALLL